MIKKSYPHYADSFFILPGRIAWLTIRTDLNTIIELDKQEIKAFAIKDGDSLMIFDKVAAIDSSRYFIVLVPAVSGKYALYRDLRTRFVKSDYHSDGMTESGNPYDEYVDNSIYYVVLPGGLRLEDWK